MSEAFYQSSDAAAKAQQRVIELNTKLTEASDAYYKRNQPIMPDAEFDALEKELKGLVAQFPALNSMASFLLAVGTDLTTTGRISHAHQMLSIENKYDQKDLIEWYLSLPMATQVCLEPKFDGISVSLIYRDHKLFRALTRGDGKSGEDISSQAFAVSSIPKTLSPDLPAELEVRGELVMQNSTLERINKEAEAKGGKVYSSTRNLTGGTMKLKDLSLIPNRQIQIMPWDVIGDDAVLPDSGLERLKLIAQAGFPAPLGNRVSDADSVSNTLQLKLRDREKVLRQILSLETDGVVIKVDSHKLRRQLGIASKYTNWQVCFKPQSASGTTYLRSIVWQTGRTGRVSPVAICDPVILAGAKVTNANLNNITWIREKGLKIGAKVEMLRSGDVIPQIVRVLDEGEEQILPPINCPECSTVLEESDEGGAGTITHRCPSRECPGRVCDTLTFIGGRECLEIDGLGPEMAKKLAAGYARDLGELYQFLTEIQEGIAKHGEDGFMVILRSKGFDVTILKMAKSLEAAKTASWERWMKALAIPMIGATLGKTVATVLDLQPEDMTGVRLRGKLLQFTQQKVDGFGEAKIKAIEDWVLQKESFALCEALGANGVRPTPVEKPKVVDGAPLKDVSFCITGEFSEDRDSITKKLVSLGASAKSGVSSKLTHLIVGEAAGKSKLTKATQLGIQQVGKEWLVKILTDNGLKLGEDAFKAEEV